MATRPARPLTRMRGCATGRRVVAGVAAWLLVAGVAAQEPFGWIAPTDVEGLPVALVDVQPPGVVAETVRSILKVKAGEPLQRRLAAEDQHAIWGQLRLPTWIDVRKTADGGVVVVYRIKESPIYARAEFKGHEHFSQSQINTLLRLPGANQWTDWSAAQQARYLQERYREDGFRYARVDIRKDPLRRTVTFVIDEGPRVTVRGLHFRGNAAFPSTAFWNLSENLIAGAKLESAPGTWFAPTYYNEARVRQDIQRLVLFYRGRGFRDAEVELVGVDFTAAGDAVDLTFRIDEGPRYRVASVTITPIAPAGREHPYYSVEELRPLVKTVAGSFYDRDQVNLDLRELEKFYGKRGHPSRRRYDRGGARLQNMFEVPQPRETFDMAKHEVHLTFEVHEGSPKLLRDVLVRGNSATQDEVIRRRIRTLPGETLDMDQVERAKARLEGTRYFENPGAPGGVAMGLAPSTPDQPDVVDLTVDIEEGSTGALTWGVGVSSDFGVQASIDFQKRNFDIGRPPSSFDPATIFSEIANNEAFHGAGQDLSINFRPGSRRTDFIVSFYEPDVFGQHFDTIGLRVNGFRTRRRFETFITDSLGLRLGFERAFTEEFRVGLSSEVQGVDIDSIQANAPSLVWDVEGSTTLVSTLLDARYADLDRYWRPTEGLDARIYYEVFGGLLGGGADFYRTGASIAGYVPIYEDERERRHVLYLRNSFDLGGTYGNTRDVFPTERFYMGGGAIGGSILRGFRRQQAGPTQFDEPTGGEAMYLSTVEYGFPLVSTRFPGQYQETEIIRGVVLSDLGLLGSTLTSEDFGEVRWAAGVGLRITVPGLNLPLALDLAWPILFEETDDRRQFFFSLSPR